MLAIVLSAGGCSADEPGAAGGSGTGGAATTGTSAADGCSAGSGGAGSAGAGSGGCWQAPEPGPSLAPRGRCVAAETVVAECGDGDGLLRPCDEAFLARCAELGSFGTTEASFSLLRSHPRCSNQSDLVPPCDAGFFDACTAAEGIVVHQSDAVDGVCVLSPSALATALGISEETAAWMATIATIEVDQPAGTDRAEVRAITHDGDVAARMAVELTPDGLQKLEVEFPGEGQLAVEGPIPSASTAGGQATCVSPPTFTVTGALDLDEAQERARALQLMSPLAPQEGWIDCGLDVAGAAVSCAGAAVAKTVKMLWGACAYSAGKAVCSCVEAATDKDVC